MGEGSRIEGVVHTLKKRTRLPTQCIEDHIFTSTNIILKREEGGSSDDEV